MSLLAPWALFGLLALPIIWWVQRHRQKPAVIELPTLMFVLEEDERVHQPRKRRLDVETLLALSAAALVSFAAAGPVFQRGEPIKRVRVVVAGGAPAHAAGYAERVAAAVRAIEATGAEVQTTWLPPHGTQTYFEGRPAVDALLGAARAGRASVRVIVSDRLPRDTSPDVRWVGVGTAETVNEAIVGARLVRQGDRFGVFVTLLRDPPPEAERRIAIAVDGRAHAVVVGPEGYGAATLPLPGTATLARIVVARADALPDALLFDDEVGLSLAPLRRELDPALPPRVRAAVDHALAAAVGREALADGPGLRIGGERGGRFDLCVGAVREGGAATAAPRGVPIRQDDPLVADLDPSGVTFVYAAGDDAVDADEQILLGIRADERTWPIVTRRADGRVRFAPDPTRGDPAPAEAPLWPLLIENVLRAHGSYGVRTTGLLDSDASTLGRDTRGFDPAWVARAAPTQAAPVLALRTPLVILALLVLGALWAVPLARRRAVVATAAT